MIYAKAMVLLAVLLSIGMAIYKYGTYRENLVRVEYQQRDLKAATDYAQKEREVTAQYRSKEENWQQQFAAASRAYQKGLANAETAKLAAISAVESGALRLRLTDSADCKAAGNSPAEVAGSTGRPNDPAEGRFLGKADSAFLIAEASRADLIVTQFSSCQQILSSERR